MWGLFFDFVVEAEFINGYLGGYLAGVFFIIGFSFGQEGAVYHGAYCKEAAAAFNAFVEGFELEVFAVFIGPAVEFVFMVDFEVFEVLHKEMGQDNAFHDPEFGLFKALVEVYGAHDGFEGIAEDLAHPQGAVELIEVGDFFEAHFNGNLVERGAVHHFAAHFGEKSFFFIRVLFEEKIGYNTTQDRIAQVFQAFIVLIRHFFYGTMGKCSFI